MFAGTPEVVDDGIIVAIRCGLGPNQLLEAGEDSSDNSDLVTANDFSANGFSANGSCMSAFLGNVIELLPGLQLVGQAPNGIDRVPQDLQKS